MATVPIPAPVAEAAAILAARGYEARHLRTGDGVVAVGPGASIRWRLDERRFVTELVCPKDSAVEYQSRYPSAATPQELAAELERQVLRARRVLAARLTDAQR
jgi:hypothetical protein